MSTCNFAYKNRCIVVTNDDFEMDNLPPMGKWLNNDFNYPSRILAISDDFDFWDIVMTSGYYEAACIDYIESERDVEYFLGSTMYYSTKRELFNACKEEFGLSEYRLCKICGKVKDFNDYDEWIESSYEKITKYLADNEERKVNEYLDGVKKLYGYGELKCTGVFSNGEGIYEKVG